MERSAKEDAPSPREYRALRRAARNKVDSAKRDTEDFRLECRFVLRLMGELGMRAGEVCHIRENWVNFDRQEIVIPSHDRCDHADDGGPCGYCQKAAQRAANNNGDSYERELRDRWEPKIPASARTIPFAWADGLVDIIDEYLYRYDAYPYSRVSINRRIDTIATACDMIEKEDVYPHALRGHAATSLAQKGMKAHQLTEFMGWSKIEGAKPYIELAAGDIRQELDRIH